MEATSKKILSVVASRRFRKGEKAIFKEPIFKAHASLGDKINFILSFSLIETRFQSSPYAEAYSTMLMDSCLHGQKGIFRNG